MIRRMITVAVRRPGSRPIERMIICRTPPSAVHSACAGCEPAAWLPPASAKRPARPRFVVDAESPRPRPCIVFMSEPRLVVITCAIDNRSIVYIAACVSCRIPDICHLIVVIVNAHIAHVVDGIARRNRVDHFGNSHAHHPRAVRIFRFKPHSSIAIIISSVYANDRR